MILQTYQLFEASRPQYSQHSSHRSNRFDSVQHFLSTRSRDCNISRCPPDDRIQPSSFLHLLLFRIILDKILLTLILLLRKILTSDFAQLHARVFVIISLSTPFQPYRSRRVLLIVQSALYNKRTRIRIFEPKALNSASLVVNMVFSIFQKCSSYTSKLQQTASESKVFNHALNHHTYASSSPFTSSSDPRPLCQWSDQ